MNRTIGSGIFTVPPKVLAGTGSVGGALLVWTSAGLIALCGAYTWLEIGLSIPRRRIRQPNGDFRTVPTPRSGAEKNYLEYLFPRPKFLATSVYGIMFLLLGNISGNAIAFGIYVTIAVGREPLGADAGAERSRIAGIAVALLTFCALTHIFTRRGGIWLGNILATFKVLLLLTLIILGFVHAGKQYLQSPSGSINEPGVPNSNIIVTSADINRAASTNYDYHTSFGGATTVASCSNSLLYALFPFSGFEQPLMVLSEVKSPRRRFPKYVPGAVLLSVVLYVLLNISYLLVIPAAAYTAGGVNTIDFASTFLHYLFDTTAPPQIARRVMAGFICVSLVGNVLAMTFTAARVKQEIAKEGILPFSLWFAKSTLTPWAWFKGTFGNAKVAKVDAPADRFDKEAHRVRSPAPALLLHWASSVVLIAATGWMLPLTSYSFLTQLHSYVTWVLYGALIGGGMFYLKAQALIARIRRKADRGWSDIVDYLPWLSPVHVIIYFVATVFVGITVFVPPGAGSPFDTSSSGYPWWVMPTVGASSLLWGVFWWAGLMAGLWFLRRRLEVTRVPYLEVDQDGHYVLKAEIVTHQPRKVLRGDEENHRHDDPNRVDFEMT